MGDHDTALPPEAEARVPPYYGSRTRVPAMEDQDVLPNADSRADAEAGLQRLEVHA